MKSFDRFRAWWTPWRAALVLALATVMSVVGYAVAQADAGPTITIADGAIRYFSPNGDGQEDVVDLPYCLASAANVTVRVEDGGGHVVRTLEDGVSRQGSAGCGAWNNDVSWDGTGATGQPVPDGIYTLRIHAVDGSGQTA